MKASKDGLIYQLRPVPDRPSLYRPKGWTDTVAGYVREAKKLTMLILRNRESMGRPYTWHVTINVEKVQAPKRITALWSKACAGLRRRGVVALWVREPTKSGKVHYHVIVKSQIRRPALERAIKESMPPRAETGWHKRIQPVMSDWQLAHYVTKAKLPGWVGGKRVDDYYARKRLLFRPKLGLVKSHTVGAFWEKPKASLWREIVDREKRIGEGLDRPGVQALVDHVYDLLGGTVDRRRIERSFGYHSTSDGVRGWAERVTAGDDGGWCWAGWA